MHEQSLVRSLLRQVTQIVADQEVQEVREVTVSIGPLSGVEPELVRIAFDQLAASYGLVEAKLAVIETTLDARCLDCEACFAIENFQFRCPICQSPRVRVVGGDDFRLLELTVDEPVSDESQRNHPTDPLADGESTEVSPQPARAKT